MVERLGKGSKDEKLMKIAEFVDFSGVRRR